MENIEPTRSTPTPVTAMTKAGLRTDEQRVYDIAESILIETDFNEHDSVVRLKSIVRNDVGMLEAVLAHYLSFVSTQMPDFRREAPATTPEPTSQKPQTASAGPAKAKRGARAIRSVQSTLRKTLFDTYKILDGRSIGDVVYGELDNLTLNSVKDGALFKLIKGRVSNADGSTKVRELITAADLQKMAKEAEKIGRASVNA